jgi:plastocyanin
MKSKLTFLTFFMLLFILGCSNNDEESVEIFFDPDVSSNTTSLGQTVVFTDYSTGVKSRIWNFPGGTPSTSTEKVVSVQFSQVGLINCTIQNTFTNGITDTKDIFIQVGSGLINYEVDKIRAEAGETIVFTDNSNSVQSRVWTFPDGSPNISTDQTVNVVFNQEGPVKCKLEVTFLNGIVDVQEIDIQIGKEKYPRSVFGFENPEQVNNVWQSWVSNGTEAMVFSHEYSPGNGANQTNGFLKIDINTAGIESQLFTKGINGFPNAILESFKTYEFSFWIKSNDYTTVTAAEVSNQNDTQTWRNFAWYSPIIEVGNEWSFKTITFQTGDLTQVYSEGTANNAWTQFKFIQPNVGTIYLDEISLKEIQ